MELGLAPVWAFPIRTLTTSVGFLGKIFIINDSDHNH